MSGLTFDAASHTYAFDGNPIPGVTTILKPLTSFHIVRPDILAAASAFGTAVHLACEQWDRGTLDEAALDPALVPYLDAWKLFSAENIVNWTMIEDRVHHPIYRYAGTLDRFGTVNGKQAVVDIKSSVALYPATGMQLAAYKNAIPGASPMCARLAVQLKADGSYVAKPYTDRDDWPTFLSLLTLRTWCERHRITPHYQEKP